MQVSFIQASKFFDSDFDVTITTDVDSTGITWNSRDATYLHDICDFYYSQDERLYFHVQAMNCKPTV